MRDFFLKDLRLKLFAFVLAVLIWAAIHLAIQRSPALNHSPAVPSHSYGTTNRP